MTQKSASRYELDHYYVPRIWYPLCYRRVSIQMILLFDITVLS